MVKKNKAKVIKELSHTQEYLDETRYHPVSNSLYLSVASLNEYKRRALDLGCGALRDSKFLFNCGFVVDAIDKDPLIQEYTDFFKDCPKGSFNLIAEDYNTYDLGNEKYLIINAQNTISFNTKSQVNKLVEKVYNALLPGGCFSGNLFGQDDSWVEVEDKNMSFYSRKEAMKLLKKFKIKEVWETDEDGFAAAGIKRHFNIIYFYSQKPT